MNPRELMAQRATLQEEARALNAKAEAENRNFSADEQARWDALMGESGEIAKLDARIQRAESLGSEPEARTSQPVKPAPVHLRNTRGDSFEKSLRVYLRDGDVDSELRRFMNGNEIAFRASNNTDMNITTPADGGYLDPTTLYGAVIARRSEMGLAERLGVQIIPGNGTTVNVPTDDEADGEFVSTGEGVGYDQDAPAVGQAQMTLVKYSKYITLSHELLEDESAGLMPFLTDWIARSQAKTMNSLIVTEVAANGTSYNTTASASAIAAGELEKVVLNDTLADYLDDTGSIAHVMRASTFAAIQSITGNARLYAENNNGGAALRPPLLGYPVFFSNKVDAIAASKKVDLFGNWRYLGWRPGNGFTMLRDPYSAAGTGQVKIWMHFRTVFKVLQAGALGYLATHS